MQASDEPHDAFLWVPPPRRRPWRLILRIEITPLGRILADPPGCDAVFYGSDVLVFGAYGGRELSVALPPERLEPEPGNYGQTR